MCASRRARAGRASAAPPAITSRVPGWSESKARSGFSSMRARTSSVSRSALACRCACSSLAVGGARVGRAEAREPQSQVARRRARRSSWPAAGSPRRRPTGSPSRSPRRRPARTGGSDRPAGVSWRKKPDRYQRRTGCGQLLHPVLDVGAAHRRGALRAQGQRAAAAGRSKVNISFWTTSVDSPTPRANSSVCSKAGVSIRP